MKVRFFDAGRWCDNSYERGGLQFTVKAGEVRDVTSQMADVVVTAGRGEIVSDARAADSKDDSRDDGGVFKRKRKGERATTKAKAEKDASEVLE